MDFRQQKNKCDAERVARQMTSQGQYWLSQQAAVYLKTGAFDRALVPDSRLLFATKRLRKQMADRGHLHNDEVLATAVMSTVIALPAKKSAPTGNGQRSTGAENDWGSLRRVSSSVRGA